VRRRALVGLLLLPLAFPAGARADADPASDVLIGRSIFVPYNADAGSDSVKRLQAVLQEAAQRKFRIKVALIAEPSDLGGVFQLYRQPQRYAQFLGQELVFVYGGPLVVAMPNGFGYSDGGARVRRLERALTGLKAPGRDPNALADGATTAVLRIARASGHPLPPPPKVSGGGGSETRDRIVDRKSVV